MKKRMLSLLLVLIMVVGMLPVSAMAEGATDPKLTFEPTAKLAGTEGSYTTENATDINAKVEASWQGSEVTSISTGNVHYVTVNGWDTVKYDFKGWLMQGQGGLQKLLPMHNSSCLLYTSRCV